MSFIWLPLNGDLHNQGISNIIATGTNVTINTSGKIGSCYSFNGSSSYITLNAAPCSNETTEFSYTCWAKFNSTTSCCLFSNRTATNSNGVALFVNNSGNILYDIGNERHTKKYAFSVDTWYHLAFTYKKGAAKKIYINGTEIYSASTSDTMTSAAATKSFIGASQNTSTTVNGNYLNGYLNDVRIWNDHCLSAAEVKEIAQGLIQHYKLSTHNLINKSTLTSNNYINASGELAGTSGWFASDYIPVTPGHIYQTFDLSHGGSNTYIAFYDINKAYKRNVIIIANENLTLTAADTEVYMRVSIRNLANELQIASVVEVPSIIQDSSGYNHNGSILNEVTISSDTPRYDHSTNLVAGNSAINCGRGGMVTDSITVNFWLKSSAWANPVSCTQSGGWNFEASDDCFRFVVNISGVGYKYGKSTTTRAELCNNQWHMLTGVYDRINGHVKIYVDGELDNDYDANTNNSILYHSSNVIWLGAEASSSSVNIASNGMAGLFSDFRIYCTPLLDTDIKQLYNISMKVDKQANIHAFELDENKANKITKTGILYNNIIEPYLTLPDGSNWKLLLYHYVDGGDNLFTQSNATYCNELGLYSRLKDINNYTYNNKYEFYVVQDGIEYRWTQTSQPTAASISGLTTVSGYTNPINGLAKANQANTYLGYGSWWGACGCWTKYSTCGKTGIPGFGAHNAAGMCTEYLALYARIDDSQASFINLSSEANQFIER